MTGPDVSHEQWEELAAGYTLDALEPDEELAFTAHLAGCAECAAIVAGNAEVAAELGALADSGDLPAPAWQQMRTAIVGPDAGDTVRDIASARRRRPSPTQARLLAAAAALVVLAGAAVAGVVLSRGTTLGPVAACRQSASCAVVLLHASDGARQAAVLVEAGRATVVPLGMPPAPSGRTWALWQVPRDGRPRLLTEFRGGSAGRAAANGALVSPYADTMAFAISQEPAATVPATPTQVVATGTAT
jgi:anti-sigma-K factor RskA